MPEVSVWPKALRDFQKIKLKQILRGITNILQKLFLELTVKQMTLVLWE